MINYKSLKILRRLTFSVILFTVLFTSCKEDNDFSSYIGDWTTQQPVPATTGYVSVNYYLKLSNGAFTESFMEVQRSSSSYYNPTRKFISIEGSLLVSDSTMIFTAQKISFSRFDITTSTYSEPYQTFTRGKDNIDSMLSGFIFATAGHKTQYHIEQGKLSIAVDYNENGDFSDDHGAFLYTRQ